MTIHKGDGLTGLTCFVWGWYILAYMTTPRLDMLFVLLSLKISNQHFEQTVIYN